MKLVELLARELKEWPTYTDSIWQDYDKELRFLGDRDSSMSDVFLSGLCSDCLRERYGSMPATRVTREEWEAERARIAKPQEAKWIRHRGGKCPVEAGVLVDLKLRGGVIHIGKFCDNHAWIHSGQPFDIMAYRICEPAKMPEPLSADEWQAAIGQQDGPLQWRDRIHAIDIDIAAQNEAHRLAIETLEEERVSLVQRLAEEGLQLVGATAPPAEDMGDWRNWRKGDLVECLTKEWSGVYKSGTTYRVRRADPLQVEDELGGGSYCEISDDIVNRFKWHSRPTA